MQRQWIEESFELVVSSAEENGAVRKSDTGDRFTVEFNEPIGIPRGAIDPVVQCMGASVWWTIPNIVDTGTQQNNLFQFVYSRTPVGAALAVVIDSTNNLFSFGVLGAAFADVAIPPGVYTFPALVNAIHSAMATISSFPLVQMQQFVSFAVNPDQTVTVTVDLTWTSPDPNGGIWGFQPGTGFAAVFGWPSDSQVLFIGPPNQISSYTSPGRGQFSSNIVTGTNLALGKGLYNIDQLEVAIKNQMVVAGLTPAEADAFISLEGDNSQQRVILTMTCPLAGDQVTAPYNFEFGVNGAKGFEGILGFTQWPRPGSPGPSKRLLGNYPDPGGDVFYRFYADEIAAFNSVNYILVHTDMVPRGIRYNGTFYQIVAQLLVDVSPGEQIVYAPFNPPVCDSANLVGAQMKQASFWLTDDRNNPVDTLGEDWSVRLLIKYKTSRAL